MLLTSVHFLYNLSLRLTNSNPVNLPKYKVGKFNGKQIEHSVILSCFEFFYFLFISDPSFSSFVCKLNFFIPSLKIKHIARTEIWWRKCNPVFSSLFLFFFFLRWQLETGFFLSMSLQSPCVTFLSSTPRVCDAWFNRLVDLTFLQLNIKNALNWKSTFISFEQCKN